MDYERKMKIHDGIMAVTIIIAATGLIVTLLTKKDVIDICFMPFVGWMTIRVIVNPFVYSRREEKRRVFSTNRIERVLMGIACLFFWGGLIWKLFE